MAITRRQFVTRLGTLAAALGVSQLDLAKITEAFAHGSPWGSTWYDKPQVFWVHGAECTGCSTSLLSLFEDARGTIQGTPYPLYTALDLAVNGDGSVADLMKVEAELAKVQGDLDAAMAEKRDIGERIHVNERPVQRVPGADVRHQPTTSRSVPDRRDGVFISALELSWSV